MVKVHSVTDTTLLIFPHAGGAPAYYAPLAREFSADVRCIAVPYPGRGGMHDVASLNSIEDLADRLGAKLTPERVGTGRVAFFGHSMGALVAFETARRFAAAGRPVDALFVSACAAPGHSGFDDLDDSDEALLAKAAAMTGIDRQLLVHEEFAARILPTLRGFRAITQYRVPDEVVLATPLRAYAATDDVIATVESMRQWEVRTSAEFTLRSFDGHHFYVDDHAAALASDVEGALRTR